jgi:sugar (pentulose or hexulose) kinase
MRVIGLDIGTTCVKACVFDERGALKGYAFREYGVNCAEPGLAEQDAEEVWRLAGEALKESVAVSKAKDIAALSTSVQGDAIIPIDQDGSAIGPAILGMDYRSARQARSAGELLGERALFDRTGMRPHPLNSIVKMLWLKTLRKSTYTRAWRLVTYADFVTAKLCGEPIIDQTMASRSMGFDLSTGGWSSDIITKLGLDIGLLSPVRPSGTTVGTIRSELADKLGLPRSLRIVTGGHDQCCAALGAGVVGEGRGVFSTGTAEVFSASFVKKPDPTVMFESYYPLYLHAVRGCFFTFALNHTGGILLRWYRETLGLPEASAAQSRGSDAYDEIVACMPADPSPVMVLPHFNGSGTPFCDLSSRGAIVGLTLATTRHDVAKAILEGLCFELRINRDRMTQAGIRLDDFVAVGGGAKSAAWLQLKADIMGRPIKTLAVREAACLGAGLLALAAAGAYASPEEAARAIVKTSDTYEPRQEQERQYEERYRAYQKLYPTLKSVEAREVPREVTHA